MRKDQAQDTAFFFFGHEVKGQSDDENRQQKYDHESDVKTAGKNIQRILYFRLIQKCQRRMGCHFVIGRLDIRLTDGQCSQRRRG